MSPFFSVIVPAYNRDHLIGVCIDSVLKQVNKDFELIIVDDGSTDNTRRIVDNFQSKHIIYIRIANSERGAARNRGIKAAKGSYITFLDSDDMLYPDHLVKAKEMGEELGFPEIYRLAFEIKTTEGEILERALVKGKTVNKKLVYGNILGCLGVFIKSEIIKEHLFVEDRRLAGTEDYELWLRLGSRYTIWNSNSITAAIIQHNDRSVLNQNIQKLEDRIRLFISYVFSDIQNTKVYGNRKRQFIALRFSYVSLHAALSGDRKVALTYLLKAFFIYPLIIYYRRFYIILYKVKSGRKE